MLINLLKFSTRVLVLLGALSTNVLSCDFFDESNSSHNSSLLMNIGDLTPVKDGMTKEEAKSATRSFFQKEVFTQQNEVGWQDIRRVDQTSSSAGRSYTLITLHDRTQWVPNVPVNWNGTHYVPDISPLDRTYGLQRFLGALYLKKAINNHSLEETWRAIDAKFLLINPLDPITVTVKKSTDDPLKNIFTIDSRDFIALSRYAGEKKPDLEMSEEKFKLKKFTSFSDLIGNVNLRVEDGSNIITIIDTAYDSFHNEKLDSYEKYMIPPYMLSDDEFLAPPNYIVNSPSFETEQALGGATFSFSREDLLAPTY
jgi:hypothetical protein